MKFFGMRSFVALFLSMATLISGQTPALISAQPNIVDVAVGTGLFPTLIAAVQAAGLADTLAGAGTFTVFAPNEAAFAKLPMGVVDFLLKEENKQTLTDILLYHVLGSTVPSSDVANGLVAPTLLEGANLEFLRLGNYIKVNDAEVVTADVEAINGIIHVIDTVLIPPGMQIPLGIVDTAIANGFDSLVRAVSSAGLVSALEGPGPYTVFAPTNEAFAALPPGTLQMLIQYDKELLSQILLYHVVEGQVLSSAITDGPVPTLQGDTVTLAVTESGVMVNDANVVLPDVVATNGVVHVIDKVLLPPGTVLPLSIVDTAAAAGSFTTLLTAATQADLVDLLNQPGPFTVFAPTDDAFAAVDPNVLTQLAQNPNALGGLLSYHVIPGRVFSDDALKLDGGSVTTLSGQTLDISVVDGKLFVNNAEVITPDIMASNGVIHVINSVLVPAEVAVCRYGWFICWVVALFQ